MELDNEPENSTTLREVKKWLFPCQAIGGLTNKAIEPSRML
jgi:hypothetical protein